MARKSHNKRHRGHRRGRRGGTLAPLQAGAYPDVEMGGTKWNTSVNGGAAGAAAEFKSFIQQVTGGSQGAGASAAMNRYAMEGVGQSGGGSRRRRHRKMGTRRRRGGAMMPGGAPAATPTAPPAGGATAAIMKAISSGGAPAVGAPAMGATTKPPMASASAAKPAMASASAAATGGRGKVGGMFATFGALLKEALVPLGLLAAQQTYGKTYGKKHRSSGSHTRKHRR